MQVIWNLLVLVDPSLLHHTFLLGPARFTALRISALAGLTQCVYDITSHPSHPEGPRGRPVLYIVHLADLAANNL